MRRVRMPGFKGKAQRLAHFLEYSNGTPTTRHANARARNATAGRYAAARIHTAALSTAVGS